MKRGTIDLKCVHCRHDNTVGLMKPSRVMTSTFGMICSSCAAKHIFSAKLIDGEVKVRLLDLNTKGVVHDGTSSINP